METTPIEVFEGMRRQWLAHPAPIAQDAYAEDVVIEIPFAPAGQPRRFEGRREFLEFANPRRAALPVRFDGCEVLAVHETREGCSCRRRRSDRCRAACRGRPCCPTTRRCRDRRRRSPRRDATRSARDTRAPRCCAFRSACRTSRTRARTARASGRRRAATACRSARPARAPDRRSDRLARTGRRRR